MKTCCPDDDGDGICNAVDPWPFCDGTESGYADLGTACSSNVTDCKAGVWECNTLHTITCEDTTTNAPAGAFCDYTGTDDGECLDGTCYDNIITTTNATPDPVVLGNDLTVSCAAEGGDTVNSYDIRIYDQNNGRALLDTVENVVFDDVGTYTPTDIRPLVVQCIPDDAVYNDPPYLYR